MTEEGYFDVPQGIFELYACYVIPPERDRGNGGGGGEDNDGDEEDYDDDEKGDGDGSDRGDDEMVVEAVMEVVIEV